MPKVKTHRAAAKRFRFTSGGKVVRRRGFKSHILEKKSPKRKRSFRKNVIMSPADVKGVSRLLGKR